MVLERAKRAASALGDKVVFRRINTFERAVFLEWGVSDALYIEDKEVSSGPPLTYERILKLLTKRARRLKARTGQEKCPPVWKGCG